jgi:phage tail protein X
MASTIYTCVEGDTLALVSFRAYGTPEMIYDIVKANKGLRLTQYLPAGLKINVPILESPSKSVPDTLLPPWKR